MEKSFLQNEGGYRDGIIHEKGHQQDASAEHKIIHPFLKSGHVHSLKQPQDHTSIHTSIPTSFLGATFVPVYVLQ